MIDFIFSEVKWNLYSNNLFESQYNILEEEKFSYPTFSILLEHYFNDVRHLLSCKLEIPSKRHPMIYHSLSLPTLPILEVTHEFNSEGTMFCNIFLSENLINAYYDVYYIGRKNNQISSKLNTQGKF